MTPEACAQIAERIEDQAAEIFKGRSPETETLKRGDPYTDGYSDGAGAVAIEIRKGADVSESVLSKLVELTEMAVALNKLGESLGWDGVNNSKFLHVFLENHIADLTAENAKLRELLWIRHGCNSLYGDDGEMQCGTCLIDFKRDPAEQIESVFVRINQKKFDAAKEASR